MKEIGSILLASAKDAAKKLDRPSIRLLNNLRAVITECEKDRKKIIEERIDQLHKIVQHAYNGTPTPNQYQIAFGLVEPQLRGAILDAKFAKPRSFPVNYHASHAYGIY